MALYWPNNAVERKTTPLAFVCTAAKQPAPTDETDNHTTDRAQTGVRRHTDRDKHKHPTDREIRNQWARRSVDSWSLRRPFLAGCRLRSPWFFGPFNISAPQQLLRPILPGSPDPSYECCSHRCKRVIRENHLFEDILLRVDQNGFQQFGLKLSYCH